MSKKSFDKFLGKKTKSPLNTDIIYGGSAARVDVTYTVTHSVSHSVTYSVKVN